MIMKSKDPESLICSASSSINKANLEESKNETLLEVYDDVYFYSCSFVDKELANDSDPIK